MKGEENGRKGSQGEERRKKKKIQEKKKKTEKKGKTARHTVNSRRGLQPCSVAGHAGTVTAFQLFSISSGALNAIKEEGSSSTSAASSLRAQSQRKPHAWRGSSTERRGYRQKGSSPETSSSSSIFSRRSNHWSVGRSQSRAVSVGVCCFVVPSRCGCAHLSTWESFGRLECFNGPR